MGRRRLRLDISKKNFFSWNRPRRLAELGGKTPPSPGRRVPVDSLEDRRFSNRSKSRRRCRLAMETSHGRSDAGNGSRFRLGTAGEAPHCGSRTPDIAVFLVRDFAKITFSTTGATQTPAGDRRLRSRAGAGTGYGTQATASRYIEENFFLLEPTSTIGRARAARPRPRPGDACRSIAPRTDVFQIARNRVAVAGTPWKLRTDVPTDVPTPAVAAGSDSERRGKLLTVGVALRT